MKFHCDRCKTRYSIADERVRGKILKIRCKSCSAVITVKEGMDAPTPTPTAVGTGAPSRALTATKKATRAPSPPDVTPAPALKGAFEQVMKTEPGVEPSPSASDSLPAAPSHIEEEWYVSIDGEQEGPLSLAEARAWIGRQRPADELYCWSEGFDDWQPVDKVSHFRGLRDRPAPVAANRAPSVPPLPPPGVGAQPAPRSDEPQPLFAATMASLERDAGREPHANGHGEIDPRGVTELADGGDENLDLDIGEVSRIVKLPQLAAMHRAERARAAAQTSGAAGLPGMSPLGRGTGSTAPVAAVSEAVESGLAEPASGLLEVEPHAAAAERHKKSMLVWLVAGGAVVVGAAVAIILVLSSGGSHASGGGIAGMDPGNLEELGYRFDDPRRVAIRVPGDDDDEPSKGAENPSLPRKGKSTNTKPRTSITTPSRNTGKTEIVPGAGDQELKPLTPDDIIRVSNRASFSTRRCYERALKADPFLEVSRIVVDMKVDPSGKVTSVKLSSHAKTPLGKCLLARLSAWSFRESTKGIATSFPLVFEKR